MRQVLKAYAPWIIAVALLGLMLGAWYKRQDLAQRFITPPAPEYIFTEKVLEVEKIVYLSPSELDREGLLPESVKADPGREVTAVATIPEHKGDTTVIAILDTDTGATTIETRKERPSLFDLSNIKTVGLRYSHSQKVTLYGSYEFLRVGNFHAEVYGEIDSENRAYAGVGIEYRF